MNKKQKHLLLTLRKRALSKQRICCFENCNEIAIKSHLLQKNGILDQIANGTSFLRELEVDNYKSDLLYFKLTGLNEAFTFPGFCNRHDTEIFKEIETKTIDYCDYRTQLLFSYRTTMNEKRKKEINVDYYDKVLTSTEPFESGLIQTFKRYKSEELLGIQDESFYENYFLLNINDPDLRDFEFITYELPKIEVCASGVFTYETTIEINATKPGNINVPLTEIYFNLLPGKKCSVVILGCLKDRKYKCWEYIRSFDLLDKKKALKKISDLMINQVENWLCSPDFYNKYLKEKEKYIIRLTNESFTIGDERRELNFNLFDKFTESCL